MTFVDHVAEARKLQGAAQDIISDNPTAFPPHMAAVILLDEARLEAQLAVAEQQRIANLIEVARFSHVASDGDRHFTNLEASMKWRAMAVEALGLE